MRGSEPDTRPACCYCAKQQRFWEGYETALTDLRLALDRGENVEEWLVQVREKFGLTAAAA